MASEIRPCDDAEQLRAYIDAHWRRGHVLATDDAMFRFTYMTPWVDRRLFPTGISVLGLYDGRRMTGFIGSIAAPYPRRQSYWLALWHVLPETKGTGLGGKLLAQMQAIAEGADGWIGTFGAGPEALPVYLKRGYCVRAGRRWVYSPEDRPMLQEGRPSPSAGAPALHSAELPPGDDWIDYRFRRHPVYTYDIRRNGIFRTEENAWGVVTHVCRMKSSWHDDVQDVYDAERDRARGLGRPYLMDAWAFDCPGSGWRLASDELPSVFHPPEARGNVIYAVGRPFLMTQVHKGDCDQDRPNGAPPKGREESPEPVLAGTK